MTSGCLATITASAAAAAATLFPSPPSPELLSPPLHKQLLPSNNNKLPPKLNLKLQELKGLLPLQLQFQSQPQNPLQLQLGSAVIPNYHPGLLSWDCCEDDSVLFSFGTAEKCTRYHEILSYLLTFTSCADFSQLFLPPATATISPTSLLTVDPSGRSRILFTGTPSEMRDLLSVLAEFNLPHPTHPHPHLRSSSKVPLLVPYFDRTRGRAKAATKLSALNFPSETIAPLKCKGTDKSKAQQKKRQKKNTTYNRDIFQKNYFHACESLLSLLLDTSNTSTGRGTAEAILCLKKLGPEIAHILTSFSIGIAGTGLAVLFSVACKMPGHGTRVPLSATRFFNTGFGLGLFWLSWAVNGLRDTIVQVFKGSNKLKTKDEEMALKVERSIKGVLFRAGTLVALAALRFA